MRVHIRSHLHAETILEGEYSGEWRELLEVFTEADVPLRPAGPFTGNRRPNTPKRQRRRLRGSERMALLPIDQGALNQRLDRRLRSLGWTRQPFVAREPIGTPLDTYLKGDFEKRGVFVEVEFGNSASLYRDLFKFQIAGRTGVGAVGVLVVATAAFSRLFDSGVATFEQATSLLPFMNIGLGLPVVLVGLDVVDWDPIRRRYEEMLEVAEANGIACHPFAVVKGVEPQEDAEPA